jgi:hypothetical protein
MLIGRGNLKGPTMTKTPNNITGFRLSRRLATDDRLTLLAFVCVILAGASLFVAINITFCGGWRGSPISPLNPVVRETLGHGSASRALLISTVGENR